MKLSDLIAEIGDANVQFQMLSDCLIGNQSVSKGVVQITFGTTSITLLDLIDNKPQKRGMVLWLPAEKTDEIMQRARLRKSAAEHLQET